MRTAAPFVRALLYLIIYVLIFMSTNEALSSHAPSPGLQAYFDRNPVMISVVANVLVVLVYMVMVRLQKQPFLEAVGCKPWNRSNLLLFVAIGISLGLFIAVFAQMPWVKQYFPQIVRTVRYVTKGGGVFPVILGSVVVGSLMEEWLFRGLLFQAFHERLSGVLSVLLQAVLFGAVFMNVSVGIFAGIGAVIYGLVRYWSGSTWPSLIVHICSTGTLYFYTMIGIGQLDLQAAGSLLVLAAGVLTVSLYRITRGKRSVMHV
ncbi:MULTISPECIES: CPBP family intramembrane glutamic endopeptidase [Paenibacillus]|uniref:CPBP family intramembrane glutamic endopeptidase n=1 Tax=Paenibacillus TaxID=44249 RepID=UPI0022B93A36|nr:CPBP family intramembrane glutamic endopeptidase [Paenibacillus caseinilyticus]MCZ8518254.1 CPBP family intramembrane metalloprotease [Paenibacillus caseinilyticus]